MKRALPYIVIALGLALVILGIWRGEVAVVLSRASNICLECIGIG
jgi:hypothetical protein